MNKKRFKIRGTEAICVLLNNQCYYGPMGGLIGSLSTWQEIQPKQRLPKAGTSRNDTLLTSIPLDN